MKKTLGIAALVVATAASGVAFAADMPRGQPYYSAPAPMGVYNWAGLYAGVNVGYQWGETSGNPTEPSGVEGGVQAGYNWQSGQFVFGGETDLQVSGAEDTFAPWQFANPWFGTLRGRAGFAMNNILLYGTLGAAYGSLRGETIFLSETRAHLGWTAGFGMEVGINPRWSAKAEYLYMDLSERNYSITGTENGLESNLLRFGVNYRF